MILCREVIRQFHYKLLLSSKIAKAEAVVVEPVKWKTSEIIWFKLTSNRNFNGENFFSLSAALPYDPFRSMAKNWHQYCKLIFHLHPFCTQRLNSLPSKSINFYVFFLSRWSAVITLTLLLLLLFVSWGQGELMARGIYFRKLRLEEYTAPSNLWLC